MIGMRKKVEGRAICDDPPGLRIRRKSRELKVTDGKLPKCSPSRLIRSPSTSRIFSLLPGKKGILRSSRYHPGSGKNFDCGTGLPLLIHPFRFSKRTQSPSQTNCFQKIGFTLTIGTEKKDLVTRKSKTRNIDIESLPG